MNLLRDHLTPTCQTALAMQQRIADKQARRWLDTELAYLLRFEPGLHRVDWQRPCGRTVLA